MTPEIATQLADHHARIENTEKGIVQLGGEMRHLVWWLIGIQSTVILCLIGILVKK